MLVELFDLTDLVINKGIPFRAILLLLLTKIPETFSITVPMSLIMAVIMTFGRMANDNELTALRMAGYPLHWMLIPPLFVGLILAITLVGMHQYGLPQLSDYKQKTLSRIQIVNPIGLMKPKTYLEIPPYTIYAEEIEGQTMKSVWIEDRRHSDPQIIISESGKWSRKGDKNFILELNNGTLHQKGGEEKYRILQFDRQVLEFNPEVDAGGIDPGKTLKPLTQRYRNYRKAAKKLSDNDNGNAKLAKKYRKLGTEFHRTVALPFATFFLVLVTAPTGLLTRRYGTVADLVFCLSIFFIYYIILSLTESLATLGYTHPAVAMWSPNLVFGLSGVVLFWYLRRNGI